MIARHATGATWTAGEVRGQRTAPTPPASVCHPGRNPGGLLVGLSRYSEATP